MQTFKPSQLKDTDHVTDDSIVVLVKKDNKWYLAIDKGTHVEQRDVSWRFPHWALGFDLHESQTFDIQIPYRQTTLKVRIGDGKIIKIWGGFDDALDLDRVELPGNTVFAMGICVVRETPVHDEV